MSKNQILDELNYDQTTGSLLYKGVRYLLIRPETIGGFQKALVDKCGNVVGDQLFEGGYAGGSLSARKYQEFAQFFGP